MMRPADTGAVPQHLESNSILVLLATMWPVEVADYAVDPQPDASV